MKKMVKLCDVCKQLSDGSSVLVRKPGEKAKKKDLCVSCMSTLDEFLGISDDESDGGGNSDDESDGES